MIVLTNDVASVNALARGSRRLISWAWSEALHVGPVGKTLDLEIFARDRALVFQYHGWDECLEVEADFALRNKALLGALERQDEIVLLFGGGIRDQLSLARLVAWLRAQDPEGMNRVKVSESDSVLAEESDEALEKRVVSAESVSLARVGDCQSVWKAFVSDDPRELETCRHSLESGPLKEAVNRILREYPSAENGLSLTECQILDAISLGVEGPLELFQVCQEAEAIPFLNDWEFWAILDRLATGASPLIETRGSDWFLCPPKALAWKSFQSQRFALTDSGKGTLRGEENYALADFQERWIGGVQLVKDRLWFWDYLADQLTRKPKIPYVL
jgi:hypothetical protein